MSSHEVLNLTGVACPINYVRTKLKLEGMEAGEMLEVLLDSGEPIESVPESVTQDGSTVLEKTQVDESTWKLLIRK